MIILVGLVFMVFVMFRVLMFSISILDGVVGRLVLFCECLIVIGLVNVILEESSIVLVVVIIL